MNHAPHSTRSGTKKRVVIVDDSQLMRQLLSTIFTDSGILEVVGTAADPIAARTVIREQNPDVITLDVEMPKMDGISFLEKIMRLKPTPTVMISSLTSEGADITLRALELGAVATVAKPTSAIRETFMANCEGLINTVYSAANARVKALETVEKRPPQKRRLSRQSSYGLIAIGSSTGGVQALHEVLTNLPADCPPIAIVQHMPTPFVPRFAHRLDEKTEHRVLVAEDGMTLERGHIYIAPGYAHLGVEQLGPVLKTTLSESEPVMGHRPSADYLFQSVAKSVSLPSIGVILTGMGKDGAAGLLAMRHAGAKTIGQDAASSVVYGMNKAAFECGAVQKQMHLGDIADTIFRLVSQG